MASSVNSPAGANETLWIRIRNRPLAQQLALAGGVVAILFLLAYFLFAGPGETQPPPPGPTRVGVIVVTEQPVTLSTELPGRTAPFETSDVRPQVDGIIRARLFTEGDYVREGQPLYHIDPVTYEARVASATRRAGQGPGLDHRRRRPGPPLRRAGEAQLRLAPALRRRRLGRRRSPRRRRRPARRRALGRDRPRPHHHPGADLGPHRALGLHHRRAGPGRRRTMRWRRSSGSIRSTSTSSSRAPTCSACASRRCRARSPTTRAPVRLQLETGSMYPLEGSAAVRRRDGRSGDRLADHPRRLPQPATFAAARDVRPRPVEPGHPGARHAGPAARGQPQ